MLRSKIKVVIYGGGDFAKQMQFYLENDGGYEVVAFTIDERCMQGIQSFCGKPLVPFETVDECYSPLEFQMLVCIGYKRMRDRKVMYDKAIKKGFSLMSYIHPSVNMMNSKVGSNNIILQNVTVEPNVLIGDNNVIWSDTLICHSANIGSHIYIAPKVLVSGNSLIGSLSFLGSNVTLIDGVVVSDETFLIMGSVCFDDTEACGMYVGNPARKIRSHEEHGIIIRRI